MEILEFIVLFRSNTITRILTMKSSKPNYPPTDAVDQRRFPTLEKFGVFHIGQLDANLKRVHSNSANEGVGLSVTTNPSAWRNIVEFRGAPTWALRSEHPQVFVDALALTQEDKGYMMAWAQDMGYLRPTVAKRVTWVDEVTGQRRLSLFDTSLSGAEAEIRSEVGLLKHLNPEVTEVRCFAATADLNEMLGFDVDLQQVTDVVVAVYTDQELLAQGIHGIWWETSLDLAKNQAPRGVISRTMLDQWKAVPVSDARETLSLKQDDAFRGEVENGDLWVALSKAENLLAAKLMELPLGTAVLRGSDAWYLADQDDCLVLLQSTITDGEMGEGTSRFDYTLDWVDVSADDLRAHIGQIEEVNLNFSNLATRIADATGVHSLPPDPEGQNDDRARWAQVALLAFEKETGTEPEDAIADLLSNLMHLCDRKGLNFNLELATARRHYLQETDGDGTEDSDHTFERLDFETQMLWVGKVRESYPHVGPKEAFALAKRAYIENDGQLDPPEPDDTSNERPGL